MDSVTILMVVIALGLMAVAYWRQDGSLRMGLETAVRTLLNLLPLLIAVFTIIGLANVLLPRELIASWLGADSGLKGILVGTFIGIITPPSVFAVFPMAATFYRAGAGIGATVAFITSWSLLSVFRIPLEIGIVGLRPTLIRLAATILIPPLVGLLTDFALRFEG
ncbi:MAG: permease [Chloroflexota bacterium]